MQEENIETILYPNETILWSGKPESGFRITFEDLIKIPFLVFFIGISISLFKVSLSNNSIYELSIISVFLILGGIYIFVNNYIIEQFRRKKYSYLITNHRLIFIKNNSFESLILDNIKQISFEEHPFKYIFGSVIIGELETIFGSNNESFKWKYLLNYKSGINFKSNKYSFDFIKDYKEVKLLLENEILKNKSKI